MFILRVRSKDSINEPVIFNTIEEAYESASIQIIGEVCKIYRSNRFGFGNNIYESISSADMLADCVAFIYEKRYDELFNDNEIRNALNNNRKFFYWIDEI
jgi:hypothetical protein